MKKITAVILLLAALVCHAQTNINVVYSFVNGLGEYQYVKQFSVQPMSGTFSNAYIIGDEVKRVITGPYYTNRMISGLIYKVKFYKQTQPDVISATFTNYFPTNISGTVYASDWTAVSTNLGNGIYAYSMSQVDALLANLTNGFFDKAQLFDRSISPNFDVASANVFNGGGQGLTGITASQISGTFGSNSISSINAGQIAGGNLPFVMAFTNGSYFANGTWYRTNSEKVIQASLDALPVSNSRFIPGGGTVILAPGVYDTTNIIIYSNSFFNTVKIIGAGMTASFIKANGNYIALKITSNTTNDAPLVVKFEDLAIVNSVVCTNYLLDLEHWGSANINQCLFADWYNLTNNTYSSAPLGMQVAMGEAPRPTGLVGVFMPACQGDGVIFEHCNFDGLGNGIISFVDHDIYRDCQFQCISDFLLPTGVRVYTNTWPNTSLYSIGAGIHFGASSQGDRTLYNCDFYKAQSPIVNSGETVRSWDQRMELCRYDALGINGNIFFFGYSDSFGSGLYSITNGATYGVSPGVYSANFMLSGISSDMWFGFKNDNTFNFSYHLNNSGDFVANSFAGNATSLTNLNATQLISGTVPLARISNLSSNQMDVNTWQAATNVNYSQMTNSYGGFSALANTNLTLLGATVATNVSQPSMTGVTLYVTNATPHSCQVFFQFAGGSFTTVTNFWAMNYGCTFPSAPNPVISPANVNAEALNSYRQGPTLQTTTGFQFFSAGFTPGSGTPYLWNVQVIW